MFEILPPPCIIERNVLIALTWQLVRLPEPALSRTLILNSQCKALYCGHEALTTRSERVGQCAGFTRTCRQRATVELCLSFQWARRGKALGKNPYYHNSSVAPRGLSKGSSSPKGQDFSFTPPPTARALCASLLPAIWTTGAAALAQDCEHCDPCPTGAWH